MLIPKYAYIASIIFLMLILLIHVFSDRFEFSFHPKIPKFSLAALFMLTIAIQFCDVVYVLKDPDSISQYYSWGGFKKNAAMNILHLNNENTSNNIFIDYTEDKSLLKDD